jgi:hypothetical protein
MAALTLFGEGVAQEKDAERTCGPPRCPHASFKLLYPSPHLIVNGPGCEQA